MSLVAVILTGIRATTEIWVRCLAPMDQVERSLAERPHVSGVRRDGRGVAFEFQGDEEGLAGLLAGMVEGGLRPVEFGPRETDLEDAFLQLTQGKVQ